MHAATTFLLIQSGTTFKPLHSLRFVNILNKKDDKKGKGETQYLTILRISLNYLKKKKHLR